VTSASGHGIPRVPAPDLRVKIVFSTNDLVTEVLGLGATTAGFFSSMCTE
jgi:hypothetical protein